MCLCCISTPLSLLLYSSSTAACHRQRLRAAPRAAAAGSLRGQSRRAEGAAGGFSCGVMSKSVPHQIVLASCSTASRTPAAGRWCERRSAPLGGSRPAAGDPQPGGRSTGGANSIDPLLSRTPACVSHGQFFGGWKRRWCFFYFILVSVCERRINPELRSANHLQLLPQLLHKENRYQPNI